MVEWMQRTLEVEFKEWFREEEPETDHEGFFQSALPAIVMQVGPQEHGYRWGMALLRPPRKDFMACRLSLNHLHFPLALQMLNENIQVASLITNSLQQKIYNMALEELEAFLGRSVEPLTPLSTLTHPGAMAKHHRWGWRSAMGHPMLIQVTESSAASLPMGLLSQPLGTSALRACCPKCLSAEPSQGDPEWVPLPHPALQPVTFQPGGRI